MLDENEVIMMKIRNEIYLVLTTFFLIFSTWPGTAKAAEEQDSYYSGKIHFKPSVEVFYRHDSNFYLEDSQEISANTYVLKPGFEFGYVTPKSEVLLDYFLSVNEYSGDERVERGDYYGHDLAFGAQTQVTRHILVGIQDDYIRSRSTGALDNLGNEVNREIYETNALSPFLHYVFNSTWGMDFRYTNLILDYDENLNEDSTGHRGTFDLNYYLNPTSLLILEYNVWNRDYDKNTSSYTSHQAMMAYEKEYKFFFLKAGLGYHTREFNDIGDRDFTDVVWNLSLYGEMAKARYYIALDRNFNDFGEGQQYYKGISVTAKAGYLIKEKVDLEIMLDYRHRNYQNDPKTEDIWGGAFKVSYLFTERISLGVKWGFEQRDSNLSARDYENRYVILDAKYSYDFSGR